LDIGFLRLGCLAFTALSRFVAAFFVLDLPLTLAILYPPLAFLIVTGKQGNDDE